jgi:hypothetical protein
MEAADVRLFGVCQKRQDRQETKKETRKETRLFFHHILLLGP